MLDESIAEDLEAGLFEDPPELPIRGNARFVNKVLPKAKAAVLSETIKPIKGRLKTKTIGTIDIETLDWVKPYAIGFYALDEYRCFESEVKDGERVLDGLAGFKCIDEFLDFFLQPKHLGMEFFAHNGGGFDFQFLVRRLLEPYFINRGFTWRAIPIQSCMFKIEITHPKVKGKWILLDSMRLMPMSLQKAGKKLGLGSKLSVVKELGCKKEDKWTELAKAKNARIMRKYNEQDCKLLHAVISRYQHFVNSLGAEMKGTTPATSMDLYRRVYQNDRIYNNRHFPDCPDFTSGQAPTCLGCGHAYARRALTGGRTEIFTMGFSAKRGSRRNRARRLYYEDFNSMYPAMMRGLMPAGQAVIVTGGDSEKIAGNAARFLIGLIECEVYIPEDCYLPPLPVRYSIASGITEPPDNQEAKLVFPVGHFAGVWTTAELALLPLVGGKITRVIKQVWYGGAHLFREFVDDLYKYRDKTRPDFDLAYSELAKLFMNSLFGKYGQREERIEFLFLPGDEPVFDLQEWIQGSDIFVRETYVASDHIAPQISAYITSLARATLWRRMKAILDAGGTLYYCDTDSVVYEPGDGRVPVDAKELGATKVEHIILRARFTKPKFYLLECVDDCPCRPKVAPDSDDDDAEPWFSVKVKAKGYGKGLSEAKFNQADFERLGHSLPMGKAAREAVKRNGFTREVMVPLRTALAGFASPQKIEFPRTVPITKRERTPYDKRTIDENRKSTRPLILNTLAPQTIAA